MPKRKHENEETDSAYSGKATSVQYSIHSPSDNCEQTTEGLQGEKRRKLEGQGGQISGYFTSCYTGPPPKKRVRFDGVTLFYFERSQGFVAIPSRGGTTLGMTRKHHRMQRLSLTEHELEVMKQRDKQSQAMQNLPAETSKAGTSYSSTEHTECLLPTHCTSTACPGDETEEEEWEEEADEEEEEELEEGEVPSADYEGQEGDDCFYLQPLGARERRALLKSSGVVVEGGERMECQMIRSSRQTCGCECQGECKPESCACAKNQIKCQVDRPCFPCGCTKMGCGNPSGRVEFNPVRVRTHYIHTMMRLKMESSGGEEAVLPSPSHIRFDGADSYCDTSSSTDKSTSPQQLYSGSAEGGGVNGQRAEAVSTQPIPSFHTFFYPGSASPSHSDYLCGGGQDESNASYWHLDAGSYATPDPVLSHYPPPNGASFHGYPNCEMHGAPYSLEYGEKMNGNLDASVDSGFIDNYECLSVNGETYSLSSLYQHQNHKTTASLLPTTTYSAEEPHSSGISPSHFQTTSENDKDTTPAQELATVLKKSICGAVVT